MRRKRARYLVFAILLFGSVWLIAGEVIVMRNVNLRPDPSTSHSPLLLLKSSHGLT